MFLYKSLNINILKKTIITFRKTRTCFLKKTYMFFRKHVHVFTESHDRKQERIWKYTISLP